MMNKQIYSGRFYFVVFILLIGVAGLIWRMLYLNVFDRSFLLKQSKARILRTIKIPAYRGMIMDRFGDPLAISTPVDSVWVNPQMFKASSRQLTALSKYLGISAPSIRQKVNKKSGREFVYLKRRIPPKTADKIKQLDIPGIFFQREYRRYYPEGAVTAQVVGFTNVDDQGQEGLELEFNKWLRGIPGEKQVLKDRLGHVIANVNVIRQPKEGHNLKIALDHRMQYLAFRELKKAVTEHQAKAGSVVILDVKTGEILAMVNIPSYNPNNRPKTRDKRYRNLAMTDLFEPGSTLKVFSVVSALESGNYKPTTLVDTNPGWMRLNGHTIREVKHKNYGILSVQQVLQKSSNVGVAKMVLSQPAKNLWRVLYQLGFGRRTRSGFPGEAAGTLSSYQRWSPFVLATVSFGYGISVTALQLAHAFSILADGGVDVPVTFLDLQHAPKGKRVIPAKIAHEILKMLETVVQPGGTGTRARVPGYQVAGKTGTANIAGPNGYDENRHVASFVGVAPVSDPKLAVAVVVYDPQGKQHYGGQVAGPAFSHIMAGALRLMNVLPDNLVNK